MKSNSGSHLSDQALHHELVSLAGQSRVVTARLLVHMAEFDARRLYLPLGYDSMHAYCAGELGFSAETAYKRIRVARAARRFPGIFAAVADGRLHLGAVVMLATHLDEVTGNDLLTAAERKSKSQIEQLLAERFPRNDLPALVRRIGEPVGSAQGRPDELQLSPGTVEAASQRPKVTPLAPERFAVQFTIGQSDHELLQYAQQLLSHQIPRGDVAEVFVRALRALVPKLEKAKFAATDRPRPQKASSKGRHIPAQVRRAVSERDRNQCTFVGENGHRCEARKRLEFDHVREFARGGETTVENVRLRCRAHNQYTAEQTYGAELMNAKREGARRAVAERRATQDAAARNHARQKAEEVVPWLQALGIRADHARQAAQRCESMPNASLEERVKAALSYFAPRDVTLSRAAPA